MFSHARSWWPQFGHAEAGVARPRFPKQDGNNKCILCSRCIRICREVVGADALGLVMEASAATSVGSALASISIYILMAGVLLFRPTGLFGVA